MEKKIRQITALTLILSIIVTEVQMNTINTTQGTFRTDCFSDFDDGLCESSLITVGDNIYACGMKTFAGVGLTINRIGFIDDQILISRGDSHIYSVGDNGFLYPVNKTLIPRNFVDQNNNVYFNAEGTTYVGLNETEEEVIIDTLKEKSFNQLAFDAKSNMLYILAVKANHLYSPPEARIYRERGLYAVNTNPLKIDNRHIQAVLFEGIDNITALAIEPESQNLLIGMDTARGNQFMRLIKLKEYPCPRRSPLRYFLGIQLAKDVQKLEDMCRDAFDIVNRGGSPTQKEFSIAYNKLVKEKMDLKKKLKSLSKCNNVANRAPNTPAIQAIVSTKQTSPQQIQITTSGLQTTSSTIPTTTLQSPPIDQRLLTDNAKRRCPPPSNKELENKNLSLQVANITDRYNRFVEKLRAVVEKMDLEKDLLIEKETTTVKVPIYREAQVCLEVFELEGLKKRENNLKEVTQQLRTNVTEFVAKFKNIFRLREAN